MERARQSTAVMREIDMLEPDQITRIRGGVGTRTSGCIFMSEAIHRRVKRLEALIFGEAPKRTRNAMDCRDVSYARLSTVVTLTF